MGRPVRDDDRYPVSDLNGAYDITRSMADVTTTPDGYLAAGSAAEDDSNREAAVWRSRDGRRWKLEAIGAIPAVGYVDSAVEHAASRGDRVVLVGQASRESEQDSHPYAWISDDGGRSFRGQAVGQPGDTVLHLEVTDDGTFVIAGLRPTPPNETWFQLLRNGRSSWEPLTVSGYRTEPNDGADVVDLVADGPDILALVRVTNQYDSGTVVVRQRVG